MLGGNLFVVGGALTLAYTRKPYAIAFLLLGLLWRGVFQLGLLLGFLY